MADEKHTSERVTARLESTEKEIRELKREREQLIEDLRDHQRQLDTHKETITAKRGEDEDAQRKIRSKNEEMLQLLDEVSNLSESNETLQRQVQELRDSLEESVQQMERTTDQYSRIKVKKKFFFK